MKNENSRDMTNPLAETIQASMDFWGQMVSSCSAEAMLPKLAENFMHNDAFTRDFVGNPALAMYQTWTSNLLNEDSNKLESMTLASQKMQDDLFNTGSQLMEGFLSIKQLGSFFPFEDTSKDVFSTFKKAYEDVLSKFTHIPQLGLTRSYQEKMLQMVDKYNLFQNNMTQLGLLLSLPVKNAFKALQQEWTRAFQENKDSGNIKDSYKRWIEILEENFMTLYKSPEYTKEMAKTIQAMEGYVKVRDDIISDFLGMLPIPTQKDVEGVYKDIYELKKKVRKLEKKSSAAA